MVDRDVLTIAIKDIQELINSINSKSRLSSIEKDNLHRLSIMQQSLVKKYIELEDTNNILQNILAS